MKKISAEEKGWNFAKIIWAMEKELKNLTL